AARGCSPSRTCPNGGRSSAPSSPWSSSTAATTCTWRCRSGPANWSATSSAEEGRGDGDLGTGEADRAEQRRAVRPADGAGLEVGERNHRAAVGQEVRVRVRVELGERVGGDERGTLRQLHRALVPYHRLRPDGGPVRA